MQHNVEGRCLTESCGLPADWEAEGREVKARQGSLGEMNWLMAMLCFENANAVSERSLIIIINLPFERVLEMGRGMRLALNF